MPYSRAKEKRLAKLVKWPDVRYDPVTGKGELFYEAKDVPYGWVHKPPLKITPRVGVELDKEDLLTRLQDLGVEINPTWSNAHMKRILDGDCSPTW